MVHSLRFILILQLLFVFVGGFTLSPTAKATLKYHSSMKLLMGEKATVRGIQKLTDQILRYRNSPETIYVAIGSSPLVVAADIESRLGKDRIIHLPLSHLPGLELQEFKLGENENLLFLWLDYFLKDRLLDPRAEFVFFDMASTGRSIFTAKKLIHNYLENRNQPISRSHFLAFAAGRYSASSSFMDHNLRIGGFLFDRFLRRAFRDFRYYQRHGLPEWQTWLGFQNFTDTESAKEAIVQRLERLYFEEGYAEYQKAVELFKSRRPSIHQFLPSLREKCRQLL